MVNEKIKEFIENNYYPKTLAELDSFPSDKENILVRMLNLAVEAKSTDSFGSIFNVGYSYSTLRNRLLKRGWSTDWHKEKTDKPREIEISRGQIKETKKLQNKVSAEIFDCLQLFLQKVPKEDMPKLLSLILEKGLEQLENCEIYYQAEKRIKIS